MPNNGQTLAAYAHGISIVITPADRAAGLEELGDETAMGVPCR